MRGILVLLALFVPIGMMSGQTFGEITGQVNDPSGAIVPGAPVSATNTATNATRNTTTNSTGLYDFPDLNPGTYSVKVEAPGFGAQERTNVVIQVQQVARIDFVLTVGPSTQTVEVNTQAPLLTTEDASVGTVVETRRIEELPLNGRDYLQLVALAPNVTYGFAAPAQASSREGGSRATIAISQMGGRPTWENYTLDGVSNTDVDFNLYIVLPSVDALQEFKVQSGIYPAQFGRDMGQVNVSTKSGTNAYHGSAWEFLRNDLFDAKPYDFVPPAPPKTPYRQNQYGFVLGGPLSIPKLFNAKNRLFFMSNYEGFKSRLTQSTYFTDITQAMRSGNFSAISTLLYDPNSRMQTGPNTYTATLFPGNQIPVTRFSQTSVYLLKYFPAPNLVTPTILNNYVEPLKSSIDKDQFNQRIDWSESSNSQWFGRYSWTNESTLTPGETVDGSTLFTRASQWMISNTRVISPTKVNEARFGYSSLTNRIAQQLAGVDNVDADIGVPIPLTTSNTWGIPNISLTNNLSSFGNATNGPYVLNDRYLEGTDNFSWTIGKHSITFGGEYRYDKFGSFGNEFTRGQFTFSGQYTANPNSLAGGYSGADFLLGDMSTVNMSIAPANVRFSSNEIAAYIDDTYKVTPKLTVTLGLRWEVMQPVYDAAQDEINFQIKEPLPFAANVPNLPLHPVLVRTGAGNFYQNVPFVYAPTLIYPATATSPAVYSATPQVARDGRLGSRLINTDWNNFAPRFGIAYSPNNKWVVRTGFGVFYSEESKNSIFDLARGLSGRDTVTGSNGNLQTVPTTTYQNFINTSQFPIQLAPGLTWGANPNLPTTYTFQYLANVQRQFGNSTTLELGYNGIEDRKLDLIMNANGPVPGITPFPQRAPYPEWQAIQWVTADGVGNYNGASVKLTQRFSGGLTTLVGYTWSKALDDASAIRGTQADFTPENPHCRSCDYGPADFDVRQRLVASVLYQLPFGKGQHVLNRGGFLNEVVGGWQVTGILTAQSGLPLDMSSWDSAGQAILPSGNRLNCTGVSPYLPNPTFNQYLNVAAFTDTVAGQFGTCGRDNVYGPHTVNLDASVFKNFRITEQQQLQFRMEMFNAPNHVELGLPNVTWAGGSFSATPASSFGTIRSTSTINSAGASTAGTTGVMRQIQFALKYNF